MRIESILLLLLCCVLATARGAESGGVAVVTTSPSGAAKLNVKARFLLVSQAAATDLWKRFPVSSTSTNQHPMAFLSETEAKGLNDEANSQGSCIAQFSVTTLEGAQVHFFQTEPTQKAAGHPTTDLPAFLNGTAKVDANDSRRIGLNFSTGITNSQGAARVFSASVSLWDGQTVVLGNPRDNKGRSDEPAGGKRLLLLISPVLINDHS